MKDLDELKVILLGIIFDPSTKKILIGRRENDPHFPNLSWIFPGGRLNKGEDAGKAFKERIRETTNLEVANLGAIFAKTYPEKDDFVAIHFLCEIRSGEEKAGGKVKELKWVSIDELEKYFTTSFHPRLKEYLTNLK